MIGVYLIVAFLITSGLFFNRNKQLNYVLVSIFLSSQWMFTMYEYYHKNISEFIYFKPDAIAIILLITLSIISIAAYYHSYKYISTHTEIPRHRAIYFSAMTMLIASMTAAYLSCHIAVTWIFIELTTLSSSALIYHHRNDRSLEGTWKYVFICAISISLVFIGILFLTLSMRSTGSSDLSFDCLLSKAGQLNIFWLRLAFIFVFTGLTVKIGLVPMYTAGIDAKDKAPAPAGALFATALANVGFIGIFRFYIIISHTSIHGWANFIIMISAFLSVFVATVYMIKVKNIKRLLAYSGIEHMGIVMLGIAAGGIGYYAAILHVVLHSFAKSSLFFQMSQAYRIFQSKSIYDTGNYFKYNKTGALVILLGFICISAMPPSGMFISEFLIFRSLFDAHYYILLMSLLILLTVIIWAFGKDIFRLLFTPPVDFNPDNNVVIKPSESSSQFVLLGLTIYLGLNPPAEFVNLIHEAIKNLN